MTKKRKFGLILSSCLMAAALALSILLPTAKASKVVADGNTQSVTNKERVTNETVVETFYQERTLKKDGTGDGVTYSGLVPYGSDSISLGIYNMTDYANKNTPLFEILPQRNWVSSVTNGDVFADMFFSIDLKFKLKNEDRWITRTVRFAKDNGSGRETYPAVFVGEGDNDLYAGKIGAAGSSSTAEVTTWLPFRYDGVVNRTEIVGKDNTTRISQPTPVGIYFDGQFYMDQCFDAATVDELTKVKVDDSNYVYHIRQAMSAVNTALLNLSQVEVCIRFDKAPTTVEDSWVMFTSIGGRNFKSTNELLEGGDVFEISGTAGSTTTINLNKQVYLGDNDALTKLVEFETSPVKGINADVKEVVVRFNGEKSRLSLKFTGSSDNIGTRYLMAFNPSYKDGEGNVLTEEQAHGNSEGYVWNSYGRGETTSNPEYGHNAGYYFDGRVRHGSGVTETGAAMTFGSAMTPRFAVYLGNDANATLYTDIGYGSNDTSKEEFGNVDRYKFYTIHSITGSGEGEKQLSDFLSEKLSVSIDVTLADTATKAYFKLTNIDGQSLARTNVTDAQYASQYHSYVLEQPTEMPDYVAGDTYAVPTALKDYGILGEFGNAAPNAYTVKLNGEDNANDKFVPVAGDNTIEYFVNGVSKGSVTFTAKDIYSNLEHRGASMRAVAVGSENNGIRYVLALKKDFVDGLRADENKTLNFGVVAMLTNYLESGEKLVDGKEKSITTEFTFEELQEEDGYYVMALTVYNVTDYNREVTTVGYIEIDGTKYYTGQESRSLAYVAQVCLNDQTATPEQKAIAEQYVNSGN